MTTVPSICTRVLRCQSRLVVPRSTPLSPAIQIQRRTFFDLANLRPGGSSSSSSSTASQSRKFDRFPPPAGYSWPPTRTSSPSSSSSSSSVNSYTDTKTLNFTPRQLYDIVADVESYHEFLPFCTSSRIVPGPSGGTAGGGGGGGAAVEDGVKRVYAELGVGFKGFQEKYTSAVEMKDGQWVRAEALPHPLFQHLSTSWTFMPSSSSSSSQDASSSQVYFELHYSFTSPLYAALASGAFEKLASEMMGAFQKRAEEVYGRR